MRKPKNGFGSTDLPWHHSPQDRLESNRAVQRDLEGVVAKLKYGAYGQGWFLRAG
jgi:hypothetical protein